MLRDIACCRREGQDRDRRHLPGVLMTRPFQERGTSKQKHDWYCQYPVSRMPQARCFDQAVPRTRDGLDFKSTGASSQLAQCGDRPIDDIVADETPVPAERDQLVAANDPSL